MMTRSSLGLPGVLVCVSLSWTAGQAPQPATTTPQGATQAPGTAAPKTNLGSDANGNPLRLAIKTGHVSNYDEAKVPPYLLPDPLVMRDGTRVADAKGWQRRRQEIGRLYQTEIYGRVPDNAPKIA